MNYKTSSEKAKIVAMSRAFPCSLAVTVKARRSREALVNIKEAIGAYLTASRKHGDPIPREDQELIEAVVAFPRQESTSPFSFA